MIRFIKSDFRQCLNLMTLTEKVGLFLFVKKQILIQNETPKRGRNYEKD